MSKIKDLWQRIVDLPYWEKLVLYVAVLCLAAVPIGTHTGYNPSMDSLNFNVYTFATLPTTSSFPALQNANMVGTHITCSDCHVGTPTPSADATLRTVPAPCTWNGTGWGCVDPFTGSTIVSPLSYGLVCDGLTAQDTVLANALTGAVSINGTTGEVDLPPQCNTSHPLLLSTGVTVPQYTIIKGLAGSCHTGPNCMQVNYNGSGSAFTATNANGVSIQNLRITNTGSGVNGIDLQGTFEALIQGVNVEGFSQAGLLLETSSASSAIYNRIIDSEFHNNGRGCWIDQHNATFSASGNLFQNVQCFSSSTIGIEETGISNENVFEAIDVSKGVGPSTQTGFQTDAFSGQTPRDTTIIGMTAENLNYTFFLGAHTYDFRAEGVDAGLFQGFNAPVISADNTATYHICWGTKGNQNHLCEDSPNSQLYTGYIQGGGLADAQRGAGVGVLANYLTHTEALTDASWVTPNAGAQTVADAAATAPNHTSTASTITLSGNGQTSIVEHSYDTGSSINNTCWTAVVSYKLDNSSSGTPPAYWTIKLADSNGQDGEFVDVPMATGAWQTVTIPNCFVNSTDTKVNLMVADIDSSFNGSGSNGVKMDIWGPSLFKGVLSGGPYVFTGANAVTGLQEASISPLFFGSMEGVALSGGGSFATGSNSFAGTVTSAAATGNSVTPGFTCPNKVVCVLSDETTLGGAKVTGSSATTCTFAATASDTVDYLASCR